MGLLVRFLLGAVFVFGVLPAVSYKLMGGNNGVVLIAIAVFLAFLAPGKSMGAAFLVAVALLALFWWKFEPLDAAMKGIEQKMTRALTPGKAQTTADKAADDLVTKTAKSSLDLMQQGLNSCLRNAVGADTSLAPKMKTCLSGGQAYQQTKAFQTCLETSVLPGADAQTNSAVNACHSQYQGEVDDIWKGFLVAVLCKIPSATPNPKCPT